MKYSPTSLTLDNMSSSSKTSSTALAAAVTNGPPPKVVPWSPGTNALATFSVARIPPIGTPPPIPLAIVMTSGFTPNSS